MKAWLANLIWDALWIVLHRLHDWVFDPARAAQARMRDRDIWWAYKLKADASGDERAIRRAKWFEVRFKFQTDPAAAFRRGDLSKP